MYQKNKDQTEFLDFYLPFGGKLRADNRWVILSHQIPWSEFEENYSKYFSKDKGAPAKSVRVALGSLIIKEKLGTSDRETLDQIIENPYLQFFLGFSQYSAEAPFDASMFVHFRKRFSAAQLSAINERILEKAESDKKNHKDNDSDPGESSNSGKLLLDATCAPSDITFPTDIGLLNHARELSEQIIDQLHHSMTAKSSKPRTYRQRARKEYLSISKSKQVGKPKIRKAIGKQLNYLKRNLKSIEKLSDKVGLGSLSKRDYKDLLVITELYRQQRHMYENRTHRVSDRIVSISQPHIRPIVRGKKNAKTEFGAKLSISLCDGFAYVDRISFDPYNETEDLEAQVESFKRRTGHYPESVHADQIYRTLNNRKYCKEKSIRLSGAALGRPPQNPTINKATKKQVYKDEIDRIAVEGKFGQAKRRFGLAKIKTKLADTSHTAIAMTFIVVNLEKLLKAAFLTQFIAYINRLIRIINRIQHAYTKQELNGVL